MKILLHEIRTQVASVLYINFPAALEDTLIIPIRVKLVAFGSQCFTTAHHNSPHWVLSHHDHCVGNHRATETQVSNSSLLA